MLLVPSGVNFRIEWLSRIPDKQIAQTVKGHVKRLELGGEGALGSIGAKFEDRVAVLFRHKEIARSVNGQAPRGAKPRGERAFGSHRA